MDVARLAGVSRATVSYVVNSQTSGRVPISEETRRRVLDAVAQLGYVPDARAQALRSGSTKTIGLIIPDISNPHFWENADGVEQEARAAGYQILLSSSHTKNMYTDNTYAEETFKNLSHRRIDGLILTPSYIYQSPEAQNTLNRLIKRQFPIVEITDHSEPTYEVDRVSADYQDITYEVMSHLISLQHKRIGLIFGVPIPELGMDRLIAYQESLQAAGLPIDPDLIARTGPTIEDGYHATRQLLELPARPTALLAINDILAIGALRAINDLNLSVPQDVSLVGYDDIPMAKFLVPRLSSVSKDGEKMGREAMRLLLARLKNPDLPRQEIRLPARFINRESIAAAPF